MNNYYWYFAKKDHRLRYGDGRLIEVGTKHTVEPPLRLCERGLHASKRAIDALTYAPGPVVCRVELGGEILHGDDKSCASERTYLSVVDAEDTLRAFARRCALDVVDLWDAPDVVREYLETGDAELRADAESAAYSGAGAAVAVYADWSTAEAAARYAAEDAAMAARFADEATAQAPYDKNSKCNEWLEEMLLDLEKDKNE